MAEKTTSHGLEAAATGARRITQSQGCWIKYQLSLRNIYCKTVADEAGISFKTVSDFIVGRKNSLPTRAALCKLLEYGSFDELLAAANAALPRRTA
jgi:hypothetical protein